MAITRITKGVIEPNENYDTHNIVSTGIITSVGADINGDLDVDGHTNLDNVSISGVTTFSGSVNNLVLSGVVTTTGLDVNGNADISGNLSVGGVLTYEDVTSIDSVGIITARNDIHVGAGVSAVGVGTFGTIKVGTGVTIEGNGQATFVGVTTFGNVVGGASTSVVVNRDLVLRDAWGYGNHIKFHWGTNTLNFPSASLSNIARVPNLSFGDRTNNGNTIGIGDFLMYHDYYNMHMRYYGANGNLILSNKNTEIHISGANGSGNPQQSIRIKSGATEGVILYHGGNAKFETAGIGASVYGTLVATGADINGDLDVDGHTNLDNLSVAGVTTFTGNTFVNDSFFINDTGNSTPLSITGNFGTGDNVYIQNNNSGGHVQFGLRTNDTDGNHHRAYITAERGTGVTANGKLSILARTGSGPDFGWIIDAGVGIQANYDVIPETDSSHNLGTSSKRWTNVYSDNVNVSGTGIFGTGTFNNDVNVADSIVHIGDTDTSVNFDTDKISFKTGNITRVSIANTGVILDDELYINQTSSGTPLRIEGMLGSTENIHIKNNTSGGHIQLGFRQNDSDGNHHRAYITVSKGTGSVAGKLDIKVRGQGGGTNRGLILDAGVGVQVNQTFLPETDSTYDLGTSSKRWKDIYTDDLDVDGVSTFADVVGITSTLNVTGITSINSYLHPQPFTVIGGSHPTPGYNYRQQFVFKTQHGHTDFKFENPYGGNWHGGSTSHTRILWEAYVERNDTVPGGDYGRLGEFCSIQPMNTTPGAFSNLVFKGNDGVAGLSTMCRMYTSSQNFYVNGNQTTSINQVGLGITGNIYHLNDWTSNYSNYDTYFGFPQNNAFHLFTNNTEKLRIDSTWARFQNLSGGLIINSNVDLNADIDVDGHTNLDNVSVAGVTTFASGNVQLASDSQRLQLGSGQDLWMYHTGTSGGGHGLIQNDYGTMYMLSDSFIFRDRSTNHNVFQTSLNNSVTLFYQNSAKLSTTSTGITVTGDITGTGDLTLTDTSTDSSAGPEFKLFRNSSSPADADYLGQIKFAGESDTGVERNYAKITGKILDASNGTEDGIIEFAHIKAGSQNISARFRSDSLQLLNGTALTVAGSTTVTGNIIPSSDSATDIGTNSVRFANIYADTLYGDGSNLGGINTDLVSDTSPQLGGALDTNGNNINFADNVRIVMGDAGLSDSHIRWDTATLHLGSTGNVRMSCSGLQINNYAGTETIFKALENGACELYHDNSIRLKTYADGVKISSDGNTGRLVLTDTSGNYAWQLTGYDAGSAGSGGRGVFQDANGGTVLDMRASGGNIFSYNNIKFNGNGSVDNLKAIFGAGSDLSIFHDGSNSFVQHTGTGGLYLDALNNSADIVLRSQDNINMYTNSASQSAIDCVGNGGVLLYHQGNKKAETVSGGFTVTGNLTATGFVDSSSDIKLKTNIKTIDNALDKVLQLRGAEYDRIDRDNQHEIGVIAQEVEKIIPEVVHGDETKTVSYGNMVAVLIEAIKEQNEVINEMKKEIDKLKSS